MEQFNKMETIKRQLTDSILFPCCFFRAVADPFGRSFLPYRIDFRAKFRRLFPRRLKPTRIIVIWKSVITGQGQMTIHEFFAISLFTFLLFAASSTTYTVQPGFQTHVVVKHRDKEVTRYLLKIVSGWMFSSNN